MEHVEYAYTTGLDESEIQDILHTAETGVLALADEGDAYAIPVVHFYDGESLYFRLGMTPDSNKGAYVSTTRTACYVLHGAEPTDEARGLDSWSVMITGHLHALPEHEYDRFDTAEINRQFTPIRVFDEAIDAIDIRIFQLEVDEMTARRTVEE